jgi:hypothetical protein
MNARTAIQGPFSPGMHSARLARSNGCVTAGGCDGRRMCLGMGRWRKHPRGTEIRGRAPLGARQLTASLNQSRPAVRVAIQGILSAESLTYGVAVGPENWVRHKFQTVRTLAGGCRLKTDSLWRATIANFSTPTSERNLGRPIRRSRSCPSRTRKRWCMRSRKGTARSTSW